MTQDQIILNQKLSSQRTETSYSAPYSAPYLALCLALSLSISALSGCESDSESTPDEPPVEEAGEASGEAAGDESGEPAGEASGEPAGEESGEPAGEEAGEPAGDMAGMMEQPPLPPEYPVIQRLRAYINRQDGGLGIEAIGRDEDSDVLGFTLQYFFDDGEPLVLTETGEPIALYFSDLRQGNGEYLGVWSIPLLIENSDLVRLAEVSVTVIDSEEHASYPKRIALLDTPTVPDGDQCDLNRGLSRCDEGSLCGTAAGGRTACGEAILECPDYYDVFDLNAQEGWRYEGDTSRDENGDPRPTYGVGSCGGGTRSMLFSFTAETEGSYSIIAQPTGNAPDFQGNQDTLMWIRSHCDFSDWNAELGCNDDINRAAGDLGSRIDLDLTSGQTIYIFVDGYSDPEQQIVGWSGPFTIEVSAL